MKIVHLSDTPTVSKSLDVALKKHTSVDSRHFDLRSSIDAGSISQEALHQAQEADIIHIHGSCDLKDERWAAALRQKAPQAKWVQQHYSITGKGRVSERAPEVAQFAFLNHAERYFPYARVMPSVVLESEIAPVSLSEEADMLTLGVIKRGNRSAWDIPANGTRWACEGFAETLIMAEHLVWKCNHQNRPMRLLTVPEFSKEDPIDQCRRADLLIDSLVTGSFYPSSLEFLALGIPCFIHLDHRCYDNLLDFSDSEDLPWIFTRVEEADTMISELIRDSELRIALGENAREWIEQFYNERKTVQHYVRGYKDLLSHPEMWMEPRFDLRDPKVFWDVQAIHDTIYDARRRASGFGREILAEEHREHEYLESSSMYHFSRGSVQSWLYRNRFNRMDGLEPLFDVTRRQCLLERYAFAAQKTEGKCVLDLGSGTGYGSALLKSEGNARSVLGIDRDFLAVSHANKQYANQGVEFIQASIETVELDVEGFDLITAFEILEYVKADGAFLKRCHDWLKPGGLLFITSPDTWHDRMTWDHRRSHSRVTFENYVKRIFPKAEFFIQEPAFACAQPPVFEPKTIRPCIPEDYLDPGQVLIAKCTK